MYNFILRIIHFHRSSSKKEETEGNRFHINLRNAQLSLRASNTPLNAEISLTKGNERSHISSLPITSTPVNHCVQLDLHDQGKGLQEGIWTVEEITIRGSQEIAYRYELHRPILISRDQRTSYTWIVDNEWGGIGDGSLRSPYEVCTPLQLDRVREHVNKKDVHFRQMCDIQLADALKICYNKAEGRFTSKQEGYIGDENGWIPIGSFKNMKETTSFQGHYDGRGFKIDSLLINRPDGDVLGLFGIVEGKSMRSPVHLSNIHIGNNSVITGQSYVGAIAGNAGYAEFLNCQNVGNISGIKCVGGIAGATLCTTMHECNNQGCITGNKDWDELVGRAVQTNSKPH